MLIVQALDVELHLCQGLIDFAIKLLHISCHLVDALDDRLDVEIKTVDLLAGIEVLVSDSQLSYPAGPPNLLRLGDLACELFIHRLLQSKELGLQLCLKYLFNSRRLLHLGHRFLDL